MKKIAIIPITLACLSLLLGGCVMNRLSEEKEVIDLTRGTPGEKAMEITVIPGDAWSVPLKAGPLTFNILPQMVFWLEDREGNLAQTLYITGADYEKMRHAGKSEKGEEFYRECFPLWAAKAEAAGLSLPSDKSPYPDTVTSATPSNSYILLTSAGYGETLFLFMEINQSSDYNEYYTKDTSGWIGQPAVVYFCPCPEPGQSLPMEAVGHSDSPDQRPGLYTDMSRLDSALKQTLSLTVSL